MNVLLMYSSWVRGFVGGVLIGIAASTLLLCCGRIAGWQSTIHSAFLGTHSHIVRTQRREFTRNDRIVHRVGDGEGVIVVLAVWAGVFFARGSLHFFSVSFAIITCAVAADC